MAEPGSSRPDAAPPSHAQPTSPWREPVRGGHPTVNTMSLPGIDQLRQIVAGETPQPPLSRLTGLRIEEVAEGTATFRLPLTGWLLDATGAVPPGPLTIPADAAMACALMTELPPHTPFTTSELALRVLRPVEPGTTVRAVGKVIGHQRPIMLAQATVRDEAGTLIAHGTSLCVTLPGGGPGFPQIAQSDGEASDDDPDPWERDPPARPTPSPEASGLELLQAQIDEALEPPLRLLTGLVATDAAAGEATFSLPTSRWLCAPPPGRVQGGVVATLADAAIGGAVRTTLPPGAAFAPMELKVNYLRPLGADGREARAEGRIIHAGRRIAVGMADVVDADGRAVAMASASGLVGPAQ